MTTVAKVIEVSASSSKSIEDAGLRQLPGTFLAEIERDGEIMPAVAPEKQLRANDRLIFVGVVESVVDLQKIRGLKPATDQIFKLEAGGCVLHPATSLHRVAPVAKGTRLAAVGWVQSLVRAADAREALFDLDTARRAVFEQQGKSSTFDLLAKTYANLLRRWAEPG